MTKATNTFMAQAPARRAHEAVPGKLTIGKTTLEISGQGTPVAYFGQQARRFDATWTKRTMSGRGHVEIRPTSKLTSEIEVGLEAPRGIVWRLFGSGQGLRSLAQLFARALRYEIETRGAEEADGYDVRRTTPDLVKARTA